jgi:hypothetical protein
MKRVISWKDAENERKESKTGNCIKRNEERHKLEKSWSVEICYTGEVAGNEKEENHQFEKSWK